MSALLEGEKRDFILYASEFSYTFTSSINFAGKNPSNEQAGPKAWPHRFGVI